MPSSSRIAIVTGAGSGIGRAVSLALLGDGFTVALAGRRRDALEQTLALSGEAAARGRVVPADVTSEVSVAALFEGVRQEFGRLDVLFNNAGVNFPNIPLEDLPLEKWQAVVNINLTGVFLCTREAVRMMKSQSPQGGRIINNGSISATSPRPNSAPYTATKHAITGMTKSTALDGRKYNIACGQIDIGNTETDMAARMKSGVPQASGEMAIEPTMNVENVSRTVLLMANLPPEANILHVTVMATKMPFVGRG